MPSSRFLFTEGKLENGEDECVKENGDQDCAKLVRKVLDETGVLCHGLDSHAVHCVPEVVPSQTQKHDTPKQIIMRFTSCKDRERVWVEKEKIKKCNCKCG